MALTNVSHLVVPAMLALPLDGPVLTDFTEQGVASQWITVNDDVMGGRSRGGPRFTGRTLVFSGSTNTDGGGFSSIRTKPNDWSFENAAGIWLRFRADGREYQADLRPRSKRTTRSISYRAKFVTGKRPSAQTPISSQGATKPNEEWQVVRIPFEAFEPQWRGRSVRGAGPIDPAEIATIGIFISDGRDGAFRLEVDAIGLVPRAMAATRAKSSTWPASSSEPLERGLVRAVARGDFAILAKTSMDRASGGSAVRIYDVVRRALAQSKRPGAGAALAAWVRRAAQDVRIDAAAWRRLFESSVGQERGSTGERDASRSTSPRRPVRR